MTQTEPATAAAEGIYQVRVPLPFALNIVNCYLLRDGDGWVVVDTGLNTPPAEAAWKAAFRFLNIQPEHIHRVILTHCHPDHYGMAGWFQSLCPADSVPTVSLSEIELNWSRIVWRKTHPTHQSFGDYLTACGMPPDMAQVVAHSMDETAEKTRPFPVSEEIIAEGDKLVIGERTFTVIHAPGHSDGQLIFYDADDKLLLSGDHVLMKITPNIGLWPDTQIDPLGRFMSSLRDLQKLDVRLALPGHKALITDWRGRLEELLAHHEERLQHTVEAIRLESTVYEASLKVFNSGMFSSHEWRFAMAETLAHLEYLRLRGQAHQHNAEGIWRFQAS